MLAMCVILPLTIVGDWGNYEMVEGLAELAVDTRH